MLRGKSGWGTRRIKTGVESGEEISSYPKVSAPESNLSAILGA